MTLLDSLNPQQHAAAAHGLGPMLILAGAGTGKTRVVTYRIARLLADGVNPRRITAVTFTNKAAAEMRERVRTLLEDLALDGTSPPWLGTFHAFCLRFLRIEVALTELRPGFLVHDQDDSRAIVKACERELAIDERTWLPRRVLGRISTLKSHCRGPQDVSVDDELDEIVSRVYPLYQEKLVEANACDFDDLLMRTVLLLETNEDVRERVQERIEHLLVDEYQDTNPIQYRLIRLLAGRHQNVCAVGDEDQSIYRFRGADIGNILRFERDFPGTTVFRVERNYRSTAHILGAANAVVDCNENRKGKKLWTEEDDGAKIQVRRLETCTEEADWVASRIVATAKDYSHDQIAVMYRTNAQSRLLEQHLGRRGIPHVVIGGTRFFERREVKDILSFLRLTVNPNDALAFNRVLNVPPRGIGKGARESARLVARERGLGPWDGLLAGLEAGGFSARVERALDGFVELVEEFTRLAADVRLPDLLRTIMDRTGYWLELEKEGPDLARDRRGNLEELVSAATEFGLRDSDGGASAFLSEVALASDTDQLGEPDRVQLMTLHSSKGLEFDCVFLVGLEEGLFPHASSSEEAEDIEEERRLCYVGMTRARRRLAMSHVRCRRVFGQERFQEASRFLAELPEEHLERVGVPSLAPARRQAAPGQVPKDSVNAMAGFFADAEVDYDSLSQEVPEEENEFAVESAPVEPQPAPASPPKPLELRRGDHVLHGRYGEGTIVGVEGRAPKTKLTIYFVGRGRVKLIKEFAKLQLL